MQLYFKMDVYFDISQEQLPIIYSSNYNIHFMGLEKLHPFDSAKWKKVFHFLEGAGVVEKSTSVEPHEASDKVLLIVHPQSYLNKLKWSINVARITEVPCVASLPNSVVQRRVLRPFRYHTGGTILGNGHERDFMGDDRVYILDVYNHGIYPHDEFAKGAIRKKVELKHRTEDAEYLETVSRNLSEAFEEFLPQFIVYNAGTDILKGDPLGCLSITPEGIIQRDEIVFKAARQRNLPIVFVTSGGYQKRTARIIADSIINLKQKELLS
ncbi:hypothetical protein JTE90_019808 [Oedothorax gibbosus]|uniref:Histone deacetylase domain-containing protein n=1 Tax=Oedothorax gibbosus TaxID=931172 RepID=A0AAV6V725_9ARAC|nr:hypothetical protein JTE90_019808 [Oedothorax gibbosus]